MDQYGLAADALELKTVLNYERSETMNVRQVSVLLAVSAFSVIAAAPVAAAGMSNMAGMSMGPAASGNYGSPGRAADVTRTVKIKALDNMRFSPSSLSVRAGQTIRFVVQNDGQVTHEFVIGDRAEQREHEAEMRSDPTMRMDHDANGVVIPPHQVRTIIWQFPAHSGAMEYACHEPGHFAAGMVGTIRVVMRTGSHAK